MRDNGRTSPDLSHDGQWMAERDSLVVRQKLRLRYALLH